MARRLFLHHGAYRLEIMSAFENLIDKRRGGEKAVWPRETSVFVSQCVCGRDFHVAGVRVVHY